MNQTNPRRKTCKGAGLLILASLLQSAQADTAVSVTNGAGWLRNDSQHRFADIFLEGDRFTGSYTLTPEMWDRGKQADLFLVVKVDRNWYMHDGSGYVPWTDGNLASLKPMLRKQLGSSEVLPLADADRLFAGNYSVYAGYRPVGGSLVYDTQPFNFRVQSQGNDQLLRFRSPEAMEAYLKGALENAGANEKVFITAGPVDMAASEGMVAAAAGRASGTNLQVDGVDEADTVKLAGDVLFMLRGCDAGSCLDTHRLDAASAGSTALASLELDGDTRPEGLYLVENGSQRSLVTLSGRGFGWNWFSIWGWAEGRTTLSFHDASNPAALSLQEQLKLDGALVASRRVDDHLYVVTRYTPSVPDLLPYPVRKEEIEANAALLQNTDLPRLLPEVSNAAKHSQPLVNAENCYLPASDVDRGSNPSIITISSISLTTRRVESSACFTGDSETLYMTPTALYLATTSWSYQAQAADALVYSPDHSTTVHKFALNGADIVYRGSGEVKGHLGWDEGKKSFRMGENGNYLNVVTSIGDTWQGNSSTSLTVLRDSSGRLDTVKVIDGIGKPGEQLFAARFFGDRAYLVTFRLTDPLYVVDLADQANPRIVGELEIPGYSDYLHPISEDLLLGIGKEAVADTGGEGEARGAWYQGVKLALFDVSNPAAPREIAGRVLGKRGSDSDVLWDHHAFTWLPASGSEPARVAIPVRLHDRTPAWSGWKADDPSSWYDYTHTALYTFDVGASGIAQTGRLIGQVADSDGASGNIGTGSDAVVGILPTRLFAPYRVSYADRSVLVDDAVYYLHEGKVLGAFWGESKDFSTAR